MVAGEAKKKLHNNQYDYARETQPDNNLQKPKTHKTTDINHMKTSNRQPLQPNTTQRK